jgi:hypothetical protein
MRTQFDLFPNLPKVRNPATYWARLKAYWQSSRWREIAIATKKLANFRCEYMGPTCLGDEVPLHLLDAHHRSYINVFNEVPGVDTMCVCRACHDWIHSHPRVRADNDNLPIVLRDAG